MSEIASASINTFGPSPKAGFESPSEQLITLTYGQLQDLIVRAVQEASSYCRMRLPSSGRERPGPPGDRLFACKIGLPRDLQEQDTNRICLDIAYDRRRLTALEHLAKEPARPRFLELRRLRSICI